MAEALCAAGPIPVWKPRTRILRCGLRVPEKHHVRQLVHSHSCFRPGWFPILLAGQLLSRFPRRYWPSTSLSIAAESHGKRPYLYAHGQSPASKAVLLENASHRGVCSPFPRRPKTMCAANTPYPTAQSSHRADPNACRRLPGVGIGSCGSGVAHKTIGHAGATIGHAGDHAHAHASTTS